VIKKIFQKIKDYLDINKRSGGAGTLNLGVAEILYEKYDLSEEQRKILVRLCEDSGIEVTIQEDADQLIDKHRKLIPYKEDIIEDSILAIDSARDKNSAFVESLKEIIAEARASIQKRNEEIQRLQEVKNKWGFK